MTINIKSTLDVHTNGVKCLCYGQAGAGKTSLIGTMPSPIIISAESGLLSLSGQDIPYIEVNSLDDVYEAYRYITESSESNKYQTVALDSISEIAEVVLNTEKKRNKDGRAAYGEMDAQMTEIIRAFRDISGKHVYFSAKMEKTQDDLGRMLYAPSMPGNKLAQKLPFFFDQLMALRVERDADGNTQRALQCLPDGLWQAKDRSGKLDAWEAPDIGSIITKIGGAL